MRKTSALSATSRFYHEVMESVSRRFPIIVIESKQDKELLNLMLVSLLSWYKIDLWFYCRREKEHYITQYPGVNRPRRIRISPVITMANGVQRALTRQEFVLMRLLPSIGPDRVFAFHDNDFDWSKIETKLAQSARDFGQTVIVITSNISKGATAILKLRDAGLLKYIELKTKNYSRRKRRAARCMY